jgi:hypothetical protein
MYQKVNLIYTPAKATKLNPSHLYTHKNNYGLKVFYFATLKKEAPIPSILNKNKHNANVSGMNDPQLFCLQHFLAIHFSCHDDGL